MNEYTLSAQEALQQTQSTPDGLSGAEAKKRSARAGAREISPSSTPRRSVNRPFQSARARARASRAGPQSWSGGGAAQSQSPMPRWSVKATSCIPAAKAAAAMSVMGTDASKDTAEWT